MSRRGSMPFPGTSDEQMPSSEMIHSNDSHSLEAMPFASNADESDRPPSIAFGSLYRTSGALPETTVQSAPHRAWEEGYQSPFFQTLNPVHNDTQSKRPRYHPEPPSNSSSFDAPIQPTLPLPSSNSASPFAATITSNNLQISKNVPPSRHTSSYRQRMRKVITKEMEPNDIDVTAFVTLGISPFMAGQDIIANQNRFVRNESVFVRHLLRLQRAVADSDARHAKTEQDIYKHLEQQKDAFDKLAVRRDPDFLALNEAHQETRTRLEELSRQVAESESTQRALIDLAQRLPVDETSAGSKA